MEKLLLKYFVSFVLVLSLNSTSHAQLPNQRSGMYPGQVFVRTSFVRGEDFLKLSENDKATYIMGVVDGFLGAMLFGADDKYIAWLHQYIGRKTNAQLAAIVTEYLKQNPDRWHKPIQYGIASSFYREYLSQ